MNHHFTVVGFAKVRNIHLPDNKTASRLGRKASKLCKDLNLERIEVPDLRWGTVKSYPSAVLSKVFAEEFEEVKS